VAAAGEPPGVAQVKPPRYLPLERAREHAEEQRIVQRAKEDPTAFAALYEMYFLRIYRFVYSRVRDQSVAEDVTSDVFIKALRGIGRYQDTGRPFSAWLYEIATNQVTDRFRSVRPVEDIETQYDLSDGVSLEDVAGRRDQLRRIGSLVHTLPRPQRVAVVLKFQEDMRIEDIAAVMGKSPVAVKLLLQRAVTTIRRRVARERGEGEDVGDMGA
jgi:RNA polymerase sigma-70 factor (ECF subfamily)